MKIDVAAVRKCLKSFDFKTLFREHLGWDNHQARLDIPVDGSTVRLTAVAQKRGFVAFICPSIPDRPTRLKVDHQITKSVREHFVIYADQPSGRQVWQWVRREPGKPLASRDHRFDASQSGDPLIQRLDQIAVSLDEEEKITVVDVAGRARAAFDVDRVTEKFYDRFKAEHAAFLKLIKGIQADADLQWYTSLMLNRLMFVYFIQKKGFLDGDTDYLRNRLAMVRQVQGKDRFQSFYRYFLLRLFHDGLGKLPDERKLDAALEKLLGKVPYLNGGFFEVHQLEDRNAEIDIPDRAFEKLFDFFDQYSWHLDERPLRADNEINPDVVGYIFEKYINQKQMGAYYTKEDITEYISKNTILPFLFDAAEKRCAIAFRPDGVVWRLLRDDPDRYLYPAVRHGVVDEKGNVIPLPGDIEAGVNDVSGRGGWNRPATDPYALPTETWREHVARRTRCLDIREKLRRGEVHQINDLITLNLDIWQFARDAIVTSEGPDLLRAFWHAIVGRTDRHDVETERGISVLDPTCGSGAFLFAALRILETLYSDCLERMERFVEDLAGKPHHPEQYSDFKRALAQIADHPNERYFILKSVIINNLFGVDLMEEAVEICKLRLFLKLVAQVERVEDIEPLPDIDFNIRAGNTLVGYASLEQVRKSQDGTLGFGSGQIKRIEEDAEMVERAFRQFRAQQTAHGGKVTSKDKQELRDRLTKLDAELDRYLAGEYGVDTRRKDEGGRMKKGKKAFDSSFILHPLSFEKWKASHQPFHWFVEFYGIMHGGGFDVIIGNPPYVEYAKVREAYTVHTFRTIGCGNLYVFVMERCGVLVNRSGRLGLIVPLSLVCTDRMNGARSLLNFGVTWLPCFDIRPASLFEGIAQRLTIVLQDFRNVGEAQLYSGSYRRWAVSERDHLFQVIQFVRTRWTKEDAPITKISQSVEVTILAKIDGSPLSSLVTERGTPIYVHRICRYFIKAVDFIPFFRDASGNKGKSEDYKPFAFESDFRNSVLCFVNSSLFYWFWRAHGDGFHCGYGDVYRAPWRLSLTQTATKRFERLTDRLMESLKTNSERKTIRTKKGEIAYQEFSPKPTKPILDEIDESLGSEFGFSPEELDFIINYDIKYRMGGEADADGEDE